MRRLLLLLGIIAGLALPSAAQASNYWNWWYTSDLNCCTDDSQTFSTGQHIYYPGCHEHVNVPVGGTRWVNSYLYPGFGAWVGPFHFHGLSWATVTGDYTTRVNTAQNATHNGWNEGAVVAIRRVAYATDQYGITHQAVTKVVNQGNLDITFTNSCGY